MSWKPGRYVLVPLPLFLVLKLMNTQLRSQGTGNEGFLVEETKEKQKTRHMYIYL